MRRLPLSAALLGALLSLLPLLPACRSARPLPAGQGLLGADTLPPTGVESFAAPAWAAGDQFEYLRGGVQRRRQIVTERPEGWGLLSVESQRTLRLDREFGQLGEVDERGKSVVQLDPVDPLLHFPLWPGKRWSAEYVRRAPGAPDLPLLVHYHADRLETLELPMGRVRALRIWRRLSLARSGDYFDRVALLWYAPELGCIVRRLDDGVLLELTSVQRAGALPAATPDTGQVADRP